MLLRRLQERIALTYDLEIGDDICDFVVTDPQALPDGARPSDGGEQLLVESGADDAVCGVALYLDPHLLARLERSDPTSALHGGNVADYLTVLEGVSHFVCVAWHAQHDRDVSLLALEMQAEIDKYVTSCWLLRGQVPGRFPVELHPLLFRHTRVDPALAGARAGLYRAASDYAARFCHQVERRLLRHGRREAGHAEVEPVLRRFYRMPGRGKFEFIAQAG